MGLIVTRFVDLFSFDQSVVRKDKGQKELVLGMQSLDKAIEVVRKADISETTPARRVKEVAQNMRPPINQAHKHLTSAKQFWEDEKARKCEEIEKRISTINGVKNIVSDKKIIVGLMNDQLQDLNEEINESERIVNRARSALKRAQESLRVAQRKLHDKRETQGVVIGVGLLLTLIPIVGWIPGLTMVAVGLTVLEDNVKLARSKVISAEENVEDCEVWLEWEKYERDCLREQLEREESEKMIAELALILQDQKLQNLKNEQRRSVELSEKLMKTCHVMTNIWGKSRVLNNEARLLYSLEPLLTPLKEIVDMFTPEEQRKIKESTFLLSREVDFSGISLKLKAVAEASQSGSVQAILEQYT